MKIAAQNTGKTEFPLFTGSWSWQIQQPDRSKCRLKWGNKWNKRNRIWISFEFDDRMENERLLAQRKQVSYSLISVEFAEF